MSRYDSSSSLIVPAVPADVRSEEALFKVVEKLVGAASYASLKAHLKNAATSLRRAHGIASKRAEEGLLAGRVARASVSVQYCALLSKFGRHTAALKEALAAAKEAEEVWSILMQAAVARDKAAQRGQAASANKSPFGLLLRTPPWWIQKAVVVLVQAKHCVALELEWSLADRPESSADEVEIVRDQLIPSMHREAVQISRQLLARDHPVRLLAERTDALAKCRLLDETGSGGGFDFPEPVDARGRLGDMRDYDRESVDVRSEYANLEGLPPRDYMRAADDMVAKPPAPELPRIIQGTWVSPTDNENIDVYGVPSPSEPGGPGGSRPTSAHSGASRPISAHSRPPSAHMSRPQSAARIHQLEDQALLRPPGTAWQEVADDDQMLHLLPISSWVDAAPIDDNVMLDSPKPDSSKPSSPKDRHLGKDQNKPRGKTPNWAAKEDEAPKDIFSQWVQGNFPRGRSATTHARMASEAGMKELKRGMKMESFKLHHHEMPFLSPEDIYANKVVYSSYGRKVMKEANKQYRPERALSCPTQLPATSTNSKKPDSRHSQALKTVKNLNSQLSKINQDAADDGNMQKLGGRQNRHVSASFADFFKKSFKDACTE